MACLSVSGLEMSVVYLLAAVSSDDEDDTFEDAMEEQDEGEYMVIMPGNNPTHTFKSRHM